MTNCDVEQIVKKYTVRISTSGESSTVGSGVLLATDSKEWAYILSALHNLRDCFCFGYDFDMEFYYPNEDKKKSFLVENCKSKTELCYIPIEGKTDEKQLERGDFKRRSFRELYEFTYRDIVLIRIRKSELLHIKEDLPGIRWIFSDDVKYKQDFRGWGFSDGVKEPVLLSSYFDSNLLNEKRLQLVYTGSYDGELADMLYGYSGTGLIHAYKEDDLVLCGIVTGCREKEKNKRFYAVSPEVLIPVLESEPYQSGDDPWEYSKLWTLHQPESLRDSSITSLKNGDVGNIDERTVKQTIQKKYNAYSDRHPVSDLKKAHPLYDIGGCEKNKNYCPNYWYGMFWADLVSEILNAQSTGRWNTEYICSENGGKEKMSAFVNRLITSGLISHQIYKDSILIWQSNEKPERRTARKKLFNTIVGDILADDPDLIPNGYDLLNGDIPQIALIHRTEIIEKIAGCDNWEEAEEKIRGLVDDVWR